MHLLRFPNSVKAARRGSQPRPAPMQGRPPTAKALCKGGDRPRPKPLAWATASMRGRPWAWLAPAGVTPLGVGSARGQFAGGDCPLRGRKGRLPAARMQGVAPRPRLPPVRAAAPAGAAPAHGGTAHPRGAARG
ncbi:hypothetical protein GW17_00012164 [Ensete ventricosum]|nr:hypothetical protein GW17_00012164 [Ensete ventricosum]